MKLDSEGLPPFEPILKRVCQSAFRRGLEALEAMGEPVDSVVAVQEVLKGDRARRRFTRGVHTGYDQAQSKIGLHVVEWERQIRGLERLAVTRPQSSRRDLHAQINILRDRQLVLRRVLDGILFSIVGHELQILRRMTLDNTVHRIDPDTVETTLAEAARRNRESRYQFNIVCDLTTVVQVGDLVHVEVTPGAQKAWSIVELKSGAVNAELKTYLEQGGGSLDESALKEIETKMGQRAVSQAKRMERQIFRAEQVKRMATVDRAIDARTGLEVSTNDRRVSLPKIRSA